MATAGLGTTACYPCFAARGSFVRGKCGHVCHHVRSCRHTHAHTPCSCLATVRGTANNESYACMQPSADLLAVWHMHVPACTELARTCIHTQCLSTATMRSTANNESYACMQAWTELLAIARCIGKGTTSLQATARVCTGQHHMQRMNTRHSFDANTC